MVIFYEKRKHFDFIKYFMMQFFYLICLNIYILLNITLRTHNYYIF